MGRNFMLPTKTTTIEFSFKSMGYIVNYMEERGFATIKCAINAILEELADKEEATNDADQ